MSDNIKIIRVNPFDEILEKIDLIINPQIRWMKLSKWCETVGVSADYVKTHYPSALRKGGVYLIDVIAVDKLIDDYKVV